MALVRLSDARPLSGEPAGALATWGAAARRVVAASSLQRDRAAVPAECPAPRCAGSLDFKEFTSLFQGCLFVIAKGYFEAAAASMVAVHGEDYEFVKEARRFAAICAGEDPEEEEEEEEEVEEEEEGSEGDGGEGAVLQLEDKKPSVPSSRQSSRKSSSRKSSSRHSSRRSAKAATAEWAANAAAEGAAGEDAAGEGAHAGGDVGGVVDPAGPGSGPVSAG